MEKSLSIALCSTVHLYDDPRVVHRQAMSLAKEFNVTIFCCAPFREKIVNENLKIIGIPVWTRKVERMGNIFRLFLKLIREDAADIYIFHDTMGILLIPFIKVIKKGKIIFDIHENFHGFLREKDWIPKYFRNFLANGYILTEKIIFKFTDMLWFAVPDIAEHYTDFRKIKKLVVRNIPSLNTFRSSNDWGTEIRNQFIFVGGMDGDRSILEIIHAFSIFSKQYEDYQLILAGPFFEVNYEKQVKELIALLKLEEKVQLLGRVPYEEVPRLIAQSKVGLSLHQPTYNFLRAQPLKLFEYLAMGIPAIASNFTNNRKVVEPADCGKCVDPNNIDEISEAMKYLVADEKRAGRWDQMGRG